jgi:hypothetical protein
VFRDLSASEIYVLKLSQVSEMFQPCVADLSVPEMVRPRISIGNVIRFMNLSFQLNSLKARLTKRSAIPDGSDLSGYPTLVAISRSTTGLALSFVIRRRPPTSAADAKPEPRWRPTLPPDPPSVPIAIDIHSTAGMSASRTYDKCSDSGGIE